MLHEAARKIKKMAYINTKHNIHVYIIRIGAHTHIICMHTFITQVRLSPLFRVSIVFVRHESSCEGVRSLFRLMCTWIQAPAKVEPLRRNAQRNCVMSIAGLLHVCKAGCKILHMQLWKKKVCQCLVTDVYFAAIFCLFIHVRHIGLRLLSVLRVIRVIRVIILG